MLIQEEGGEEEVVLEQVRGTRINALKGSYQHMNLYSAAGPLCGCMQSLQNTFSGFHALIQRYYFEKLSKPAIIEVLGGPSQGQARAQEFRQVEFEKIISMLIPKLLREKRKTPHAQANIQGLGGWESEVQPCRQIGKEGGDHDRGTFFGRFLGHGNMDKIGSGFDGHSHNVLSSDSSF